MNFLKKYWELDWKGIGGSLYLNYNSSINADIDTKWGSSRGG